VYERETLNAAVGQRRAQLKEKTDYIERLKTALKQAEGTLKMAKD
jgi:hypothetical protein